MKKIIVLLVLVSLFATGCGGSSTKKTVCSDTEGNTVTLYSEKDLLTKVETFMDSTLDELMITEDEYESFVEMMESVYNGIEGMEVTFTKNGDVVTTTLVQDYTVSGEEWQLSEILAESEGAGFTCSTK